MTRSGNHKRLQKKHRCTIKEILMRHWGGKVAVLIQLLLSIVFGAAVWYSGFVPGIYLAALYLMLLVLFGVLLGLQFVRNKIYIAGILISVLISAALAAGSYFMIRTNQMMSDVGDATYKTDNMVVVVRADDPARSLTDAADYKFGIQTSQDQENTQKMLADIEETLGSQISPTEYETAAEEAQALLDGEIDADSWAWGFNVGLMWSPLENLRFGLSYRSQVNHHADGDLEIDNPKLSSSVPPELGQALSGVLGTYDASASLSAPAWAMATAAWDVNDLLSLYATFRWTDWSSFEELKIDGGYANVPGIGTLPRGDTIKNHWQDTYLFSVGADLRFTNWWTFRAGIGYETSVIDEESYRTAIIPDADRLWLALGSSFQATKNMQIDVSAAWLHGVGERDLYDAEDSDNKIGRFEDLDAYLFGVQLVYKF